MASLSPGESAQRKLVQREGGAGGPTSWPGQLGGLSDLHGSLLKRLVVPPLRSIVMSQLQVRERGSAGGLCLSHTQVRWPAGLFQARPVTGDMGGGVRLELGLFGVFCFCFSVFLLEVGKLVSCPTLFSIITAALSPADQSQ